MDVNRLMLLSWFAIHAEIEGATPRIMHAEPLLHLVLDLRNQALISIEKKIIYVQNDCGDDCALILIMEHKQSSIDMCCRKCN